MPELDGFEATRRIRDWERQQAGNAGAQPLPIVAVTAHAMEGDRERCLETGMDDHLTKPFSRARLLEMIERWLTVSRGRAAAQQNPAGQTGPAEPIVPATGAPDPSPSQQADADAGPLDPTALEQLAAIRPSSQDLVARVIRLYLDSSESIQTEIREASEHGDAERLARAVHRLKSSSGEVGAVRLAELCRELEVHARSGSLEDAAARVADLERELDRVRAALEAKQPQG